MILALDQGTSSSRALVVGEDGAIRGAAQREFAQHFPHDGWVEHDASEIWRTQLECARAAMAKAGVAASAIRAVGITNQRETVVLWDRRTGEPVARAIVWQDRRTAGALAELERDGAAAQVARTTGLLLDPYFSASKIAWLLEHVPDARERAARGELAVGTIDSWLAWKLTGGRAHVTDVSNASRTMLMDLRTLEWDAPMLELFGIPREILPRIVPSSGVVAECDVSVMGAAIPLAGMVGDQQSALFAQGCHAAGASKTTYGTGCFTLMHTGHEPKASAARLLTTVAWRVGESPAEYALEGSVFTGGALIQWLRDGLGIIRAAPDVNALAASVPDSGGVVLVPALTGLGAPHWDPHARGLIAGITRGTTAGHIARAAIDGIAWQVADLLDAMASDGHVRPASMRVDGGASASDLLMQTQADVSDMRIERPAVLELTGLGAAFMAGIAVGVWPDARMAAATVGAGKSFGPAIDAAARAARRERWSRAVQLSMGWHS
jgi:glycerol kinase